MHYMKVEVHMSQCTGERTSVFANRIWCSSVDFNGALLVYTHRRFSPQYLGMRIYNEVVMDELTERESV